MSAPSEMFSGTICSDFFHLFCGKLLGSGISRYVYEYALDPQYVVKIEQGAGSFQNIVEWETWNRLCMTNAGPWLAGCWKISDCGIVLLQRRTTPIKKFPEKMPNWFTDFKRTNYGMIGKKIVCHDYGITHLLQLGVSKRMRKVEWWDAA